MLHRSDANHLHHRGDEEVVVVVAVVVVVVVVAVVVVVVVGQTVGSISSKMLAYDCLYTLELCTASMIAATALKFVD